ncbi:hypothetical protein [Pseudoclavibacter helvolus]|uniref:hypothetical protein n=1 Tax=Pseudoclavibacter helvolus TaxID=255205 RepID=UPI0037367EF9
MTATGWHDDIVFSHVGRIIYIATAQRVDDTWRDRSWTVRIERAAIVVRGAKRMPKRIRSEVERAKLILEEQLRRENDDTGEFPGESFASQSPSL